MSVPTTDDINSPSAEQQNIASTSSHSNEEEPTTSSADSTVSRFSVNELQELSNTLSAMFAQDFDGTHKAILDICGTQLMLPSVLANTDALMSTDQSQVAQIVADEAPTTSRSHYPATYFPPHAPSAPTSHYRQKPTRSYVTRSRSPRQLCVVKPMDIKTQQALDRQAFTLASAHAECQAVNAALQRCSPLKRNQRLLDATLAGQSPRKDRKL